MKIFLDTNFIIDWLYRSEYKQTCEQLLKIADDRDFRLIVSFLSLANLAYIARKEPRELIHQNIYKICQLFEIANNTKDNLIDAININSSDFEDAIQYASALESGSDCIISRNKKDFYFSKIPVYTAEEFIAKFCQ